LRRVSYIYSYPTRRSSDLWLTFNEVNTVMMNPFGAAGVTQPKETIDDNVLFQSAHNMFVANSKAIKIIKEINPDLQVGCTTAIGDRKSTRLNSSHVSISYA